MKEFIQSLEARQLLTAAVADGVLTVTGTARADDISITLSKDGTTLTVVEKSSTSRFKKATSTKTTFTASDVTSIVVNGGAGNDKIALGGGTKSTPLAIAAILDGGDGNDNIRGAAGNDTITGDAGDDNLYGGAGNDSISGGDGEDLLSGGAGVDTLNGDGGNDLLISKGDSEVDILDGGTDDAATGEDDGDLAVVDDTETATNATVSTFSDVVIPHGGFGGGFGGGFDHGGHGHGGGCGGDSSDDSSSTDTGTSTGTTTTTTAKKATTLRRY